MSERRNNRRVDRDDREDVEVIGGRRLTRLQVQFRLLDTTQSLIEVRQQLEDAEARVKDLKRKADRLANQRDLFQRLNQRRQPRGQH